MLRDDRPPMDPTLEWLTAMTAAHELTNDRGEARRLAGDALDVWRDFTRARRRMRIEGRA